MLQQPHDFARLRKARSAEGRHQSFGSRPVAAPRKALSRHREGARRLCRAPSRSPQHLVRGPLGASPRPMRAIDARDPNRVTWSEGESWALGRGALGRWALGAGRWAAPRWAAGRGALGRAALPRPRSAVSPRRPAASCAPPEPRRSISKYQWGEC